MKTNALLPLRLITSALGNWIAESPSTRDPRLFIYMWRTYGLIKSLGIGLYDDKFFQNHLRLQGAYADLASVIRLVLKPKSVCDFGCGNGFIIHHLKQLGVTVKGVESSAKALQFTPAEVKEDILTANIVVPLSLGKFDFTISTEVAEHIRKGKAEMLIRNLAEHAKSGIFFTAAAPGQWGDGHINCQPKNYWETLFLKYGWCSNKIMSKRITSSIRERPQIDELIPWISENVMIFTPSCEASRVQSGHASTCVMPLGSVSVVIPSYNMDWCVTRAIYSCQSQSLAVEEIIVVDDGSTDDTEVVVTNLMKQDQRIRYYRLETNAGHLAALRVGAQAAASDWIALLDADDELTPNSIEVRVLAANEYIKTTGVKPQLVYGDHTDAKFSRLKGYAFPYLSKELCLCQTSTMMLGRECVPYLPDVRTNNSDDQIVLAVGKRFHVLHSGAVVTIYNSHDSPTRLTNNPKMTFNGVCKLVRDQRTNIVREHGVSRLLLWWLRILKAFVRYRLIVVSTRITASQPTLVGQYKKFMLRLYRKGLASIHVVLKSFLVKHFDHDFF
jgi:glycosyltransferase involved in cell wall biosynthesis/SAM-dependent methyltransferase